MTGRYACLVGVAVVVLGIAACRAPLETQQEPTPQEIADVRARAEQGDAEAQYSLGKMYTAGQVVLQDELQPSGGFVWRWNKELRMRRLSSGTCS